MSGIVETITSLIIGSLLAGSISGVSEVTPQEAATEFFDGIKAGQNQVMSSYADNEYMNFLLQGGENQEENERIREAVLSNMEYEIEDTAQKNNVAVAKVTIRNKDFSKVMEEYEKASYTYVMENLYENEVEDKEKLSSKCMDIYIDQIEEAAKSEKEIETEVFLPMRDNGYYGWTIVVEDSLMKKITGDIVLP